MDNEERKPDFVVGIFVDPTDDNDLSYFKKHGINEDEINDAVASAISELDLFEEADVSAYLLPNPVDSSLGDRSGAARRAAGLIVKNWFCDVTSDWQREICTKGRHAGERRGEGMKRRFWLWAYLFCYKAAEWVYLRQLQPNGYAPLGWTVTRQENGSYLWSTCGDSGAEKP